MTFFSIFNSGFFLFGSMISRLVFLLFCGHFAQILGNAAKLPRVKKQSLKVQINVTSDAVCMRYIRPTPSIKLEGFVLGYGSSFFSNQYIPLPSNGKMYITEVDAEPRYLIAVRPVYNNKKSCSGKTKTHKPLQLVIGTLTPTSVFLSWGILVNPKHDWTTMNNCPNDRFYTVRYREKDKNKKWILQLCPTTETVVDNLKPNTIYEFGVKDNTDDGIWSKSFIHKMVIPGKNKENGGLQNNYKFPKIETQFIPDSKTFIPVKVIKQVLQNITHRAQSEILKKSPLSGPILVHLIVPDFNATKQKPPSSSRLDIFEKPKQSVAKNKTQKWVPESKTTDIKEITPQSQTAMAEKDLERSKPTAPSVSKDSAVNQDLHKFLGLPKARPSPMPQIPTEPSVSKEIEPVPLEPKTPVPKIIQTKAAVTNEPTLESFPSKTSKTLDWPRATLAPSEIPFITLKWKVSATPERWHNKPVSTLPSVKQSIPKTTRITEKLKASPAEKESQQKTTASNIFKIPELPSTTMAVTNKLVPLPATTKISVTDGHPVATMASKEINPVPSKSKEFDYTKPEEPDRKFVSTDDDNYLPKLLTTPEFPITKPVSAEDDNYLPKVLTTSEPPITKPASYKPSPGPTQLKEPDYIIPEVPDMKYDAKTKHHVSITKTTIKPLLLPKAEVEEVIFKTEQAKSSTAPKETQQVPTRPKTSSPDITPTKSSLNVKHHDPSKPKSHPGEKKQQSKPEIIPFPQDLITTMVPVVPEKTKETLDPKETRLLPSKPKPSDKQGRNKTKPASSKLNNKVTVTKTPRLRKVVHRTTPAPPRTRTPGGPSWSKKPRDEDVAKPLHPSSSTKSSISVDSTVVRKRPDPATLPGSLRPPLAPARPTPMRRRPLPPNNVTGKPGRSGNILMPRASSFLTTSIAKPTWPSSLLKTNSPKKLPTAAASPDYSNPMFSSIPTSETDIAGTPRYTGDHVKYLKKKDDDPCSITDTMQLFPSDMGDNRDMATSAPQKPPTNLTVVTVEGCSSFVVLDWEKPENESVTEYKVVSTENGGTDEKDKSIITTNQTHSTVENLKPNTSYEFVVIPSNPLGEGPSSESKPFRTESADPRVTESISTGKDAIWTEVRFNSDDYSECKGKQYVKRTWYKKFVGVQLCNSLRYKIYLSDSLKGTFYNIGDQRGHGEDHCQFVDSYLDGKTGQMLPSDQLPSKDGYFRAVRQEPVHFGKIGAGTHTTYVHWYECGTTIPGKW